MGDDGFGAEFHRLLLRLERRWFRRRRKYVSAVKLREARALGWAETSELFEQLLCRHAGPFPTFCVNLIPWAVNHEQNG